MGDARACGREDAINACVSMIGIDAAYVRAGYRFVPGRFAAAERSFFARQLEHIRPRFYRWSYPSDAIRRPLSEWPRTLRYAADDARETIAYAKGLTKHDMA